MRRWCSICLAVLAGVLGTPRGAAAADPSFRALGGFDRIAVSFSTPRRVFVTTRQDAATNATTAVVSSDSGAFPFGVAWPPGAASFALVEQGNPDWGLRVIESPDGTSHDLTNKIDVLRTNKMLTRLLYAPRWIGAGSAVRILLNMASFGIASIRPDGSSPNLVNENFVNNPDIALFGDGHRAIVSHLSPISFGDHLYSELYLKDLDSGVETQLTNNPGHNNRAPALSPDEQRIVYVEDAFQESNQTAHHDSRLRVMKIDGTDNHYVTTNADLFYDQPAWRPDGARIAFVGLARPESPGGGVGRPALYSAKPDGTDLARHTDERAAFNPYPSTNNLNSIRPSDIAWGQTCIVIAGCVSLSSINSSFSGGPVGLKANPDLTIQASIGFLVERYRGKHLRRFGRVPFGEQAKGHTKVRWSLKIAGRPLPRGRYRITLRALAGSIPIDRARPVDLIVRRHHRFRLAKARVH